MNILEKIVEEKRIRIAAQKENVPLESFRGKLVASDRDFYEVLESRKRSGVPAFILECKKASPSQGLIREDFDPAVIAGIYARYADAVSVLCDEKFFSGKYENISLVRERLSQPVLCKDFIIDSYQIYLARFYGADAILLMLSVLGDEEYVKLAELAHSLNMGVLTEADSREDIARANNLGARVIGINNRNLRTLDTDISKVAELAVEVRKDAVCVSESGLKTHADVLRLSRCADAFLVGTSLMRERDLDRACRVLVYGENKVCGLTDSQDAQAARNAGAVFGGLIFAEKSPRRVSFEKAKEIVSATPGLDFVGVFQNENIGQIVKLANELKLFAVQLHGAEDDCFIEELKKKFLFGTQVWKAVSANFDAYKNCPAERILLDSGNGGSGKVFDWERIPEDMKSRAMLAGGIGVENARAAHNTACLGLDLNSALEVSYGKKSLELINAAFGEIRKF